MTLGQSANDIEGNPLSSPRVIRGANASIADDYAPEAEKATVPTSLHSKQSAPGTRLPFSCLAGEAAVRSAILTD